MFHYQQNHQTPWNRHLVSSQNWIRNETDHLMQPQDEDVYSSYTQDEMDSHIKVELCDQELWNQFSNVGTEMILTKSGRRIFPGYRVQFSGLNPKDKYCVMLDVISMDSNRYKFQEGKWVAGGRGESHYSQNFFVHPTSPSTGEYLMKNITSFHKVKLTNALSGRKESGKFVLHSMHRYQLRIHIVRSDNVKTAHLQRMRTFQFPQTTFITVTAYQNSDLSQLKIANNPFARGFLPDGARGKRKLVANIEESYTWKKARIVGTESSVLPQVNPSTLPSCQPRFNPETRENRSLRFQQYPAAGMNLHPDTYIHSPAFQPNEVQKILTQVDMNEGLKSEPKETSSTHCLNYYDCQEQYVSPASIHLALEFSNSSPTSIYQELDASNGEESYKSNVNFSEDGLSKQRSGVEISYPTETQYFPEESYKPTFQTLESANFQNFNQMGQATSPVAEDSGYFSASPNDFLNSDDVSNYFFQTL